MEEKSIKAKYTKILKYEIEAEVESALHIGNGMSDEGEVLQENHLFREQALPEHFWKQRMRSRKNVSEIKMKRKIRVRKRIPVIREKTMIKMTFGEIKADSHFRMYILRLMRV